MPTTKTDFLLNDSLLKESAITLPSSTLTEGPENQLQAANALTRTSIKTIDVRLH